MENHRKDADEASIFLCHCGDTDYKINFDPDFKDPKAYVENPAETTVNGWTMP